MKVEVIIGSAARRNGCISRWSILRETGLIWRSGFRLGVWCGGGSKCETC